MKVSAGAVSLRRLYFPLNFPLNANLAIDRPHSLESKEAGNWLVLKITIPSEAPDLIYQKPGFCCSRGEGHYTRLVRYLQWGLAWSNWGFTRDFEAGNLKRKASPRLPKEVVRFCLGCGPPLLLALPGRKQRTKPLPGLLRRSRSSSSSSSWRR